VNLRSQALARLDRSIAQLADLAPGDLTSDELLTKIREEAANLERFLKQLHLEGRNLDSLINELMSQGFPSEDAVALHALRRAANAGKHDPKKRLSPDEAMSILIRARSAVSKVGVVGVAGGADDEAPQPPARRFAISVSDYPTHSEVDYQIDVLLRDGRVVHIDSYQAKFGNETHIKSALLASGVLHEDPEDIEVLAYAERMKGSDELTTVWVYEGSLRDLAQSFAPHQDSGALPFLRRESDVQAIRIAACLAAIDLGVQQVLARPSSLVDVMIDGYAMSPTTVGTIPDLLTSLAECASQHGIEEFRGPRVLSTRGYEQVAGGLPCISRTEGMALDMDGTLLVRANDAFEPMP
jgi:hypothetical protein